MLFAQVLLPECQENHLGDGNASRFTFCRPRELRNLSFSPAHMTNLFKTN